MDDLTAIARRMRECMESRGDVVIPMPVRQWRAFRIACLMMEGLSKRAARRQWWR